MAVDFSKSWGDEIADVTESLDYQTCEIRVSWSDDTLEVFDYKTGETFLVSKQVSASGLELIRLQGVIDNPNSTPQQVSDAESDFADQVVILLGLIGTDGAPDIIISNTLPSAAVGDVWVKRVDRSAVVRVLSASGWIAVPVETEVYTGQARYIPVRAGVWQGGEAQVNATTIRSVRFQVPRSARATRFHSGAIVTIVSAPFNQNLNGRTAKVMDDFQGATTASRTFHAMMDADSEDA